MTLVLSDYLDALATCVPILLKPFLKLLVLLVWLPLVLDHFPINLLQALAHLENVAVLGDLTSRFELYWHGVSSSYRCSISFYVVHLDVLNVGGSIEHFQDLRVQNWLLFR